MDFYKLLIGQAANVGLESLLPTALQAGKNKDWAARSVIIGKLVEIALTGISAVGLAKNFYPAIEFKAKVIVGLGAGAAAIIGNHLAYNDKNLNEGMPAFVINLIIKTINAVALFQKSVEAGFKKPVSIAIGSVFFVVSNLNTFYVNSQ